MSLRGTLKKYTTKKGMYNQRLSAVHTYAEQQRAAQRMCEQRIRSRRQSKLLCCRSVTDRQHLSCGGSVGYEC